MLLLGIAFYYGFYPDTASLLGWTWPGSAESLSTAVHTVFNAVVPFATDPLILAVSESSGISITICYFFVLIIGLIFLQVSVAPIVAAVAVICVFGFDRNIVGIFAFIPLVIAAATRFARRGELALLIILFFLGLRLSYSAGPLIFISLLILLGIASYIRGIISEPGRLVFAFVALVLGVLVTAHTIPHLPVYDYPLAVTNDNPSPATVVADDGAPGVLQPLVGPAFALQVIDFKALAQFLSLPFLIAVLIVVSDGWRFFKYSGVALALVALDLFSYGEFKVFTPLSSAARLIPGAFLYPLASILLVALVFFNIAKFSARKALLSLLLIILIMRFKNYEVIDVTSFVNAHGITQAQVASPSLAVYKKDSGLKRSPAAQSTSANWVMCDVAVSVQGAEIANRAALKFENITDKNPATRISLGQAAGNTLTLCFNGATTPSSLLLDVGNFSTDFPQSFSVTLRSQKDNEGSPVLAKTTFAPWLGSLRLTPNLKIPFYSSPGDVEIPISAAQTGGNCADITLLKDNKAFDWSVAELRCRY